MSLSESGNTLYVDGDYGYEQFKISGKQSYVVDASDASWIVSNMGEDVNRYPVMVEGSSDIALFGGTIVGEVPLDIERVDAYINSAAIFLRNSANSLIQDWTITQGAWDGIRVRSSNNFTVDRVLISDIRDDAIENDDGLSGTIRNSLFDRVFVGISSADASSTNQSKNVITVANTLIRMQNYLDHGIMTHQSPFKVTGNSPSMKIYDSVIAIENVNHIGQARLKEAWNKTIDASGNYFLNLSDKPLPAGYPMPPKGFTVLQGEAAREFWEEARSDWLAEFGGEEPSQPDPEPEPQPTQPDDEVGGANEIVGTDGNDSLAGTEASDVLKGKAGNDTLRGEAGDDVLYGHKGDDLLIGNEGNDVLRGQDGNDRLEGRLGADILIGGTGDDTFRFSRPGESTRDNPDIIRADATGAVFDGAGAYGGDVIDLRGIDANSNVSGNQAFVFGSIKVGGLSLLDVDGNTHVRGNTGGGSEFELVVVIEDGAVSAADYASHDFLL